MLDHLIGPLLTGLGLVWGMYQFYIKRHDEKQERDRREVLKIVSDTAEKQEREVVYLRDQFKDLKKDLESFKAVAQSASNKIDAQSQLMLAQASRFDESIKRLERTLERHEAKLDSFGMVKVK